MAQALVDAVSIYLLMGTLFAAGFLLRGAGRLDSAAGRSGWGFRLIIGPGVVALWPILLWLLFKKGVHV